jgi:transglutaminase-like putative cysteine protease
VTALIGLFAVPLFFLLPRVAPGVYSRRSDRTQLVSGFSDRVELGEIGTIKRSAARVMRVRLDKPPAEISSELKWRGIALDRYDGRSWTRSDAAKPAQRATNGRGGWTFRLEDTAHSGDLLLQTFHLEPMATDVVFAGHRALAVSDIRFLQRDAGGSLFTTPHAFERLRYSVVSDRTRPDPRRIVLRPDLIPEEMKKCCLQLPRMDPRIGMLAKQVARGIENPFGQAQALESHLRSAYAYSLRLEAPAAGADPLAAFLFEVKSGHCEYFASAMTILLRHLGIPSRLVNGFRLGEYNSLADDWTVRQYDAHSWVEAYLPPYGWIEFDPTPAEVRPPRSTISRVMANLMDALDMWWSEEVINYDRRKQNQFKRDLRSVLAGFQASVKDMIALVFEDVSSRLQHPWTRSPALVVLLAVCAGVILILVRYRHLFERLLNAGRAHRAARAGNVRVLATGFYSEALSALKAHGVQWTRDQTPSELARSLEEHPAEAPFRALTEMYNRIRFGGLFNPDDKRQARVLLRELRAALAGEQQSRRKQPRISRINP